MAELKADHTDRACGLLLTGWQPVGLQFHVLDGAPEQNSMAEIAVFAGGSEFEHETAPDPDPPFGITLEPDAPQVYGVIQQQNVQPLAVFPARTEDIVLNFFRAPPVPGDIAEQKNNEEVAEGHSQSLN
mgnify:CR=1 FL=1